MNKVQNGAKNDTALDELCKRYENRGINQNADPKNAKKDNRETFEKKNGGQKYVSGGDFVDYYNNCRDYTPEPNVQFDTTVVLQKIDREKYEKSRRAETQDPRASARKDIKEKLAKEAQVSSRNVGKTVTLREGNTEKKITKTENGYVIREKKNGVVGYTEQKPKPSTKEVIKKASDEWIPLEERKKEKCLEGKKTAIPLSMILAIITIAMALMLIVGSAVMLSSAKSEQNRIKSEINGLYETQKLLSQELDEKNREADIESFAKEELGMINQDYVSVKYIKNDKEDGLDVYKEDGSSLWSSVIESIFPFLN